MTENDFATAPAVRHRITFATEKTLAYVSVLELGRVWERSLRRAGVPLKYSQGFNPRPRMNFAAPLPVGCGSDADLLDVLLEVPWTSEAVAVALDGVLPPDLALRDVSSVSPDAPALAEQLVAAEYRIWLRDVAGADVAAAVAGFLEGGAVPMVKRGRKHHGKTYDLRPLVQELYVVGAPAPWVGLHLRVQARPGATGRPDEVLKALSLTDAPRRCTRERLVLDESKIGNREQVIGEDHAGCPSNFDFE